MLSAPPLTKAASVRLACLSNPERLRIVLALARLGEGSPKELWDLLRADGEIAAFEPFARHFRALRRAGIIEMCGTDNKRGGTIHVYRPVPQPWLLPLAKILQGIPEHSGEEGRWQRS